MQFVCIEQRSESELQRMRKQIGRRPPPVCPVPEQADDPLSPTFLIWKRRPARWLSGDGGDMVEKKFHGVVLRSPHTYTFMYTHNTNFKKLKWRKCLTHRTIENGSSIFLNVILLYFYGDTHTVVCMWWSEDKFVASALFQGLQGLN